MIALFLAAAPSRGWIVAEIGQRVLRERLSQGLTRGQLGKLVGVSGSYIGLLETGERRFNEDLLVKLGSTLGISLAALVDDKADDLWTQGFQAGEAALRRRIETALAFNESNQDGGES